MPPGPVQQAADLEQLFFGHDDHGPAPKPGNNDEYRVDGGDVVGRDDEAPVMDEVLPSDDPDPERDVPHQPRQRHDDPVKPHRYPSCPRRARMVDSSSANASSKVKPVVSTVTASAAGRSGAAARWVSL